MVDTIFADVAQPDQARIVAINAHNFLKNGGHFVISIKVSKVLCTYSNIPVCNKILQDIRLHYKIDTPTLTDFLAVSQKWQKIIIPTSC